MKHLTLIFTKRTFNPISLAIRMANPVSFTTLAPASHVLILDGDHVIEANMLHGVRRVKREDGLKGASIVDTLSYEVHDAEKALEWLRGEARRKAKYDYLGAFGLGITPNRNWQDPTDWFCFELAANALEKGGRYTFRNYARVTANMLMSLHPSTGPKCN